VRIPEQSDSIGKTYRFPDALSAADLCRFRGWGPGTVLEGIERDHVTGEVYCADRIRLTAIGEQLVLARGVERAPPRGDTHGAFELHDDYESSWSLSAREWREVLR